VGVRQVIFITRPSPKQTNYGRPLEAAIASISIRNIITDPTGHLDRWHSGAVGGFVVLK
jgi:hypothetical protein